ncbi:unnamed protein product, partial [Staurois parvus]
MFWSNCTCGVQLHSLFGFSKLTPKSIEGRTDHLETRALPEGPGCPWYLFHRLFEFGQGHRGPMIPYCPG